MPTPIDVLRLSLDSRPGQLRSPSAGEQIHVQTTADAIRLDVKLWWRDYGDGPDLVGA